MTPFSSRRVRFPVLLILSALLVPASGEAQFRGGGITVFTDPDFGGESASFQDEAPDLRGYGLNDDISSIRIPSGQSWEICLDINYGNRCQVVTRSIANLRSIGWDDRISSLRRVGGGGFGRGPRGPDGPGGGFGGGLTVFTDTNYQGESASFRSDTPDLQGYGLNDQISSIRIPPGESWEVCQDIDYGNRCQILTRSIDNLRSIGWDNRISSLRRVAGGRGMFGRGSNPGPGISGGVTVFRDTNFRGESASFRDTTPDLVPFGLNDQISSIRIPPGESWEICQDVNFGNRCQVLTRSISDLDDIGWDDRISSLRRVGGGR